MPADTFINAQRQLFARSQRVKGIDFHPTEPWVSEQTHRILAVKLTLLDPDDLVQWYAPIVGEQGPN